MRWFGLACFIILLFLAWRKGELKSYAVALGVGGVVGFAIDYVGVSMGLWDFPRQSFLSWQYIVIVVPCWGVFGATINMISDWYMNNSYRNLSLLTLMIIALYEIPNLATASWGYTVSALIVLVGWFPMVLIFRLSYLMVQSKTVRKKIYTLLEREDVSGRIRNTDTN